MLVKNFTEDSHFLGPILTISYYSTDQYNSSLTGWFCQPVGPTGDHVEGSEHAAQPDI